MPLSTIQADVLRLIAANRSPDSYVAGATVLHRAEDTPRYSADLDLFHDLEDSVARCAETDAATLTDAACELSWLLRTPTFIEPWYAWTNGRSRSSGPRTAPSASIRFKLS